VLLSLLAAKARDGSALRPEVDPLLTRESLASTARLCLGGHDPRDPLASPLYGDCPGCRR
jgi:hypothetical protein